MKVETREKAAQGKEEREEGRKWEGKKSGREKTHLRPEASDLPCQMYKGQRVGALKRQT